MANKRSAAKTRGASGPAAAHNDAAGVAHASHPNDPPHRERAIMKRILLVDLGERELKIRQELRARRQVLETIAATAETSGGLNPRQISTSSSASKSRSAATSSTDPFYRQVAATHQQKEWGDLAADARKSCTSTACSARSARAGARSACCGSQRARDRRHLRPAADRRLHRCVAQGLRAEDQHRAGRVPRAPRAVRRRVRAAQQPLPRHDEVADRSRHYRRRHHRLRPSRRRSGGPSRHVQHRHEVPAQPSTKWSPR